MVRLAFPARAGSREHGAGSAEREFLLPAPRSLPGTLGVAGTGTPFALLQLHETVYQLRVIGLALAAAAFDRGQHFADRVHQGEQPAADFGIEGDLAAAEIAQQVFTDVREAFQPRVTEESGRALDGMNRAEHAPQGRLGGRIAFQRDQVAFELFEIVVTLYEKLPQRFA